MKIAFSDLTLPRSGALVVGVAAGRTFMPTARSVDRKSGGTLSRAIAASRFTGESKQWLEILGPRGLGVGRVLLCGMGRPEALSEIDLQTIGGALVGKLTTSGESQGSRDCGRITEGPRARHRRTALCPQGRS